MKKQFKVLLAGYGDIARRMAAPLTDAGCSVSGVRRSPPRTESGSPVTQFQADLRDSQQLAELLVREFDAVVVSVTPDDFSDEGYKNSYVAVAESLARVMTAVEIPPGLVLWVSSTSVYGQGAEEWVDESSPACPSSFSGKRLLQAEQIILGLAQQLPLQATAVRFSGIYGSGRTRLLKRVRQGKIAPAEPVAWSNRIHSRDCAGVLCHLIAMHRRGKPLETVYLATDCEPAPLHYVHSWLADRLEVKGVQSPEGETAPRANRRCCNRRLLEAGYQFAYPDFRAGYTAVLAEADSK